MFTKMRDLFSYIRYYIGKKVGNKNVGQKCVSRKIVGRKICRLLHMFLTVCMPRFFIVTYCHNPFILLNKLNNSYFMEKIKPLTTQAIK